MSEEIGGMESFGRVIRAHREARGWSLDTAARKLEVTAVALGSWERGERNPPMDKVVQVLDGYGLRLVVMSPPDAARRARIAALRSELAELEASL